MVGVLDESPDFIIVGGGPAGSALAAGLSQVPSLRVLLVEAGGENADVAHKASGNRYSTLMTAPGYVWNNKSVPQPHMNDRELGYDSGRGLGGGTAVNFGCYTRGPAVDYDDWAKMTGDEQMGWNAAKERLKKIETMHDPPQKWKNYCTPATGAHGYNGAIQVGYDDLDEGVMDIIDRGRAFGYSENPDINSGDIIGLGACLSSAVKGMRTTAAELLMKRPSNLEIRTNAPAARILFDGKKAVGIELAKGDKILARREVILSAGAVWSPHLLLLSGIGPAEELTKHSIPVVHDLPGVGQHFRDHGFTYMTIEADPKLQRHVHDVSEEAMKQWLKDQTGPVAENYCPAAMGFFKTKGIENTEEFKALSPSEKAQVAASGRPNWEFLSNMPPFGPGLDPAKTHSFVIGFMNPLSFGTLTLHSSNPSDPPVIDPKMFSHPFDRRVAIETFKEAMTFLETLGSKYVSAPDDKSDEAIWKYIAATTMGMWHASSSVAMGAPDDPLTCLDTSFKVKGVQGLRVVDCSAIPFIISAHTQAPAYNVGAAGAQKILQDYGHEAKA